MRDVILMNINEACSRLSTTGSVRFWVIGVIFFSPAKMETLASTKSFVSSNAKFSMDKM